MSTFTISAQGSKALKKKILKKLLPINLIFVFFIVYWMFSGASANETFDATVYLVILLIIAVNVVSFFIIKRQEKMFRSFRLSITGETIKKEMFSTPTVVISKNEVDQIVMSHSGAYSISAGGRMNRINVPAEVNERNVLQNLLNEIKPIIVKPSPSVMEKIQLPMAIVFPGIIILAYSSKNSVISLIGSIGFCVLMLLCFIIIQKSKSMDRRIKWMSYILFIPLVAIITSLLMRFFTQA